MRIAFLLLILSVALILIGCGDNFSPSSLSPPSMGGFGATPGGAQDMKLAREMVANGTVPPAAAILVEGMFSEHDLPLDGPDCASLLCLRGALGWEDGAGWIQIGLSSNIDPERFTRPDLDVVLLIDVSGSMGWNYGSYGLPAAVTRDLALSLIDAFGEGDRIGIATFESTARLVRGFTPGDRHRELRRDIESLGPGGSTNMEAGLRLAGDMFRELRHRGAERRVLLLTDAQPNTGATTPGAFLELATDLSTRGIGLTVVGVGMGLNPGVMEAMLSLKGGNGFGIATAEAVPEFMEENWPWCVCPIASDLSVDVTPAPGFIVERGYGFPGEDTALRAASVFLSRKRGALAVRLAGATPNDLGATVNLSYRDRQGNERGQTLVLDLPDGAEPDEHGRTFTQYSTAKMTALALLTDELHEAAGFYQTDREESLAIMARAVERFAVDVDALRGENPADAPALERELAFAEAMQALMIEGARQGDLYGGF